MMGLRCRGCSFRCGGRIGWWCWSLFLSRSHRIGMLFSSSSLYLASDGLRRLVARRCRSD